MYEDGVEVSSKATTWDVPAEVEAILSESVTVATLVEVSTKNVPAEAAAEGVPFKTTIEVTPAKIISEENIAASQPSQTWSYLYIYIYL